MEGGRIGNRKLEMIEGRMKGRRTLRREGGMESRRGGKGRRKRGRIVVRKEGKKEMRAIEGRKRGWKERKVESGGRKGEEWVREIREGEKKTRRKERRMGRR